MQPGCVLSVPEHFPCMQRRSFSRHVVRCFHQAGLRKFSMVGRCSFRLFLEPCARAFRINRFSTCNTGLDQCNRDQLPCSPFVFCPPGKFHAIRTSPFLVAPQPEFPSCGHWRSLPCSPARFHHLSLVFPSEAMRNRFPDKHPGDVSTQHLAASVQPFVCLLQCFRLFFFAQL